jgi:hypothetical protein
MWLRPLKIGDTAELVIERAGEKRTIEVKVPSFDTPSVRIVEIPGASPRQVRLRQAWINMN